MNVGDKIFISNGMNCSVDEIVKITPTGIIRTKGGESFKKAPESLCQGAIRLFPHPHQPYSRKLAKLITPENEREVMIAMARQVLERIRWSAESDEVVLAACEALLKARREKTNGL
jgi:hypothetical protein